MITKEQLDDWLSNPVTKEYKEILASEEFEIRKQVGEGVLMTKTAEEIGVNYSQNIGKADGVRFASFMEDIFYDYGKVIEDET